MAIFITGTEVQEKMIAYHDTWGGMMQIAKLASYKLKLVAHFRK